MGVDLTVPGVYIQEFPSQPQPIQGVSTTATGMVGFAGQGPTAQAVHITSFGEFQRTFGGLQANAELGYAVLQFFANAGHEVWVVRVLDQSEVASALAAFDGVDQLAMVCIPGCTDPVTLQAAITYCDQRRVFLIVDPAGDIQAVQTQAATLEATGTSNAAIYFPPVTIADPLSSGSPRASAPSGSVAGLIARTDTQRGVWAAPAGVAAQLLGVIDVQPAIDDPTAQLLAGAGINAIRSIPHSGIVAWSARTISSVEQWKYVPVRRLALFIEATLIRGLQWAVFEPNDQPLWIQMCSEVTAFMTQLWRQGAFKGGRADDAFIVKCGRDVMTQADIDAGRAVLLVAFAPAKPQEMVILEVIVVLGSQ